MSSPVQATDVIAGLALVLSGYATFKTLQFNKRQKSLIGLTDSTSLSYYPKPAPLGGGAITITTDFETRQFCPDNE